LKEKPALKHYLELHFIVFLWGFTAILGKLITIPAVELVFFRTLVAATALALILYFKHIPFRLGAKTTFKILGVGFLIAAHWILFFASARVSSVAICLAGLSTVSLWTAVLEPVFTSKRIRGLEVFMSLLIIAGLYLIFRFEIDHVVGIVMAVASALFSALFTIINSRLVRSQRPLVISCYEMAGACLAAVLFFPFYAGWLTDTGQLELRLGRWDAVWILILAVICTVYPFTSSVRLMQRISAFTVNLSVNLEPVYGILLALLIFKDSEHMSAGFYLGAVIILFSVFAHSLLEAYLSRRRGLTAPPATPGSVPGSPD
jgi:drug/metabolite transporter (DMT)-like permease